MTLDKKDEIAKTKKNMRTKSKRKLELLEKAEHIQGFFFTPVR